MELTNAVTGAGPGVLTQRAEGGGIDVRALRKERGKLLAKKCK
jgi:hypothetical protein